MGYNPNILNATLSGNTSGALAAISSGTLTLAGGNNITLSQAGNAVTISAGAGGGGVAQAAGTQTATSGTVNFADSNGVTFGMSGSNQITASVKTDYQTSGAYLTTARASNDAIGLNTAGTNITATINSSGFSLNAGGYAGTTTGSQSTVGSDIVMTHNTAGLNLGVPKYLTTAQAPGAYLTTARASNDAVGLNTAQTNVTWTVNSSGISLNAGAYLTTAMQSASSSVFAKTGFTTASTTGSDIVGTHDTAGLSMGIPKYLTTAQPVGAYLTTARASNDAVGLNTAQTNVTWTVNSSGISLNAGAYLTTAMASNAATISNINLSAGTTSLNLSKMTFADSNGISFGLSGNSVITGTVKTDYQSSNANYLTSQSNQAFSASGGSSAFQTLNFANSNGVTFSNSNGSVIASHNGLTTARASTDAVGLNTAQTNVTWTVNSSGISLNAGAYLTTAMASNRGSDFVNATAAFAGTNASGTIASNGISVSVAAPGAGAAVTASASNGSFTAGLLGFSNANNVTFGTSAGSIVTASVAAPGAAAENNWVNLLGANTAGNTTASGSTIGYSGVNLTLSGTNGSQIAISAPATSSLSATGGLGISTNGSTISIGMPFDDFYEPYPLMNAISTTYAPGIGSWNFLYMPVHLPIDSGRINMLYSMGSTSAMLAASNGNSFASNTTGGASWSFLLNRSVAIYKRGAGANSTQLESIWSNTVSNGVSQSMGVSVTNASQLTVQRRVSFQYVQSVETNGLYTTAGLGATHNASFASSNTVSSAATSAISSIYNMMSGAMLVPFGFNTTISAGDYWLGVAWSTASTTAGTSVNGASIWPQINQGALYRMSSMSHRQFGKTASSTGSQFVPGHGAVYSAASAVPPPTIPFSDLRSAASHVIPYFNIIQSVAS